MAASAASASASAAASAADETAGRAATTGRLRTVLTLAAAAVVAVAANAIAAAAAVAAGADPAYPPLTLVAYPAFTVAGLLAGYAGWRIVRARAARPAAALRVLVPALTIASLAPDVVLLATGFIPGTDPTAAVALMLMHLVVVGVGVPVFARLLPVRDAG